jgi:signal transduction histidine kinase
LETAAALLKADKPDIGQLHEIITDIGKDVKRADDVITRLSALLMRRPTEFGEVPITELAQDVIAVVQSQAVAKHVTIGASISPDAPSLRGDKIQLTQVMLNLIINAIDSVEGLAEDRRRVTIDAHAGAKHKVEIAVADLGPGLAGDMTEKIFEPFVTTKSKGMGMGLAISRTIVKAHGGRLWVTNNANMGVTFHLSLPASEKS